MTVEIFMFFFYILAVNDSMEENIMYFAEQKRIAKAPRLNVFLKGDTFNIELYEITELFKEDLPSSLHHLYLLKGEDEYDNIKLMLIGKEGGNFKKYCDLKYDESMLFNSAKGFISRKGDTITIATQYPFSSATYIVKYKWDKKNIHFIFIEDKFIDYSVELLKKVDSLLEEGEIKKAVNTLAEVLYPERYYNFYEMAVKFMKAGHNEALRVYKATKDPYKSLEIMEESFKPLLNIYDNAYIPIFNSVKEFNESGFSKFLKLKEYVVILNDLAFFLTEALRSDESVDILKAVINLSPDRMVAYLNMGDALWQKGEKKEAKKYYRKYVKMMKKAGKEDKIPARVKKRLKY